MKPHIGSELKNVDSDGVFVVSKADFPTVIGVTLDREDGSTPMETDGEKKQSGTTYYIDTNQLRVPREQMEVMSPLKNGMSMLNNNRLV